MIYFITVLRTVAAILITNSHYIGVYPLDLIANGGLLGDVIFFAVSGFCLVNIKQTFLRWYSKRIIRIYPPIWIITIIYIFLGFYTFNEWNIFEYLLYPTYYHFISSIIILYIPFYIIVKLKKTYNNIPITMLTLFAIQFIIYVCLYDKSIYHIDAVREPMIRFLFFQAMLLGAYFNINKEKFIDRNKRSNWAVLIILLVVYFISKFAFVKYSILNPYQIINQIVLISLLYFVLSCFAGVDSKLEALPSWIKKLITFISKITLEIYAVQYAIIPKIAFIAFPLNWVIITLLIIVAAYILSTITEIIASVVETITNKLLSPIICKGQNL